MRTNVHPERYSEGTVAKAIEGQTAKLPSDVFLWAGLGCLGAAIALRVSQRRDLGFIVSQFAPVFLIMGLYNKVVKVVGGSDRAELEEDII